MRTDVVPARDLPPDLIARWAELQERNPVLASPFFRPEFTQAVAAVREDVFVAVLNGGEAFFPFQRSLVGGGRPVGGAVSDYHGIIAPSDFSCDIRTVVRACGLRHWSFDHVPASQGFFRPWRVIDTDSPVVDLSREDLPGSNALHADHRRKRRRLEREVGPIETQLQSTDRHALECCLKWKSAHYYRLEVPDLFAKPWARSLCDVIATYQDAKFSGMLSVLRAGGQPIAAHFGLRSHGVWHYWFPAYDLQFQRYSPGILLLLEMLSAAPQLGVDVLDFGRGDNDYKLRLANRRVPLMEGDVVTNPVIWRSRSAITQVARAVPLVKAALTPMHRLYKKLHQRTRLQTYWLGAVLTPGLFGPIV